MENDKKLQEQSSDILDSFRKAEQALKVHLFVKNLQSLKELAKDVVEAKEESVMILEELGIEEKDIKRIIDFVNNIPESKMTQSEKDKMRENVRSHMRDEKKQTQKKMEESPLAPYWNGQNLSLTSANVLGTLGASPINLASTNGNILKVSL